MAHEVSLASKETENSASKVNDVSFSIITVSQNMAGIVDTAELVSSNMNNAGATVNQLSSSITEVCSNTLQASNISDHLMQKVDESKTLMENLGNSAQSVGKVIDVINSIAKMTDLLALNAKIEAVNAGEAGKSFVVVANEVKDVSKKTAMATKEVEKMIKNKDALVIVYCTNLKCPASDNLYIHLKKLGYKNVLKYPFGIERWLEAGNDIEMAE